MVTTEQEYCKLSFVDSGPEAVMDGPSSDKGKAAF